MKPNRWIWLGLAFTCSAFCSLYCQAGAPGVSAQDDLGHAFSLPRPAQRIVALTPHLVELLFEAGAGDRLVGVVDYSDYPPAARQLPRVGSSQKIDLEQLSQLKPDLVLAWIGGHSARELDALKALGIPVFFFETQHLEDIPRALLRIGALAGTETVAQSSAAAFRSHLQKLQTSYKGLPPIKVFYQIASQPLLSMNRHQIIHEVLQLCGGENIFAEVPQQIPLVSTESVVAMQPEVILQSAPGVSGETPQDHWNSPSLKIWRAFQQLPATASHQYWGIPADEISRPGPRILSGAQAICTALERARHPSPASNRR